MLERIHKAADFLQRELGSPPPLAMVLGSGLGQFVEEQSDKIVIGYEHIPEFPVSTVVGHLGQLTAVRSAPSSFIALQGRVHFYEGLPLGQVVFMVRALAVWGVEDFIITNAAGAINPAFEPGDLMLIRDHINLLGDNPLTGPDLGALGERFPDMTNAYNPVLIERCRRAAVETGVLLREGVYVAVKGPSYETPAEIRMLRTCGADAVGMSTVPEVIALNHMRRPVLGLSCITNRAAGMTSGRIVHEDVLKTTETSRDRFSRLLLCYLQAYRKSDDS